MKATLQMSDGSNLTVRSTSAGERPVYDREGNRKPSGSRSASRSELRVSGRGHDSGASRAPV